VPVVGPGFNFPTANSVADDFSLPQLINALGQDIGGLVIVANLTGPDCGPNNTPTTCTIDTTLSRQVVTAPFASTVSVPGPTIGQRVPSIASACTGSLKDAAGLLEEANMRLTTLISILIRSTAPTSADSIYLPILNMGLDGLQVEARTMSKPSEGCPKGREEDTKCETTAISIKLQPYLAEFGILIHENQDFQRKSTRGALI
jgi:hypothetical protein